MTPRIVTAGLIAAAAWASSAGADVVVQQDAAASQPAEQSPPVRVIDEPGKRIALEAAAIELTPAEGDGPTIMVVGVAHVADRVFYQQIQTLLEDYDVVLYEAVKPAGAGGAGGETDEERIASTEAAMDFIAGIVEQYKVTNGSYPGSFDELHAFAKAMDGRLSDFVEVASVDAWGRRLQYRDSDEGQRFALRSLGADRAVGGEGVDADLETSSDAIIVPLQLGGDVNLQAELASALGLVFQLEALDYDKPSWRPSDLSMDQLERALAARGLDMGPLGDALGGTSLPLRIATVLLRAIRVLDAFVDGAIADSAKVMLIEMIGDPTIVEHGLDEFGEGFTDVIIGDRNQVPVDDVKAIIRKEPDVGSVAILYGAAHLPDMIERLEDQLGYERGAATWFRVIDVDIAASSMDPRTMQQMRLMMRQAMRQQMRR